MGKQNDYSESQMSRMAISRMYVLTLIIDTRADNQAEFERMKMTYREDRVPLPLRSELKRKHEQIREVRDRAMSNVSSFVQYVGKKLSRSGRDSTSNR